MTRPSAAITLTPELIARFAAYYRDNCAWGVMHVSLGDSNYKCKAADVLKPTSTDEERVLVAIHDALSPSQRTRLSRRVRRLVYPSTP